MPSYYELSKADPPEPSFTKDHPIATASLVAVGVSSTSLLFWYLVIYSSFYHQTQQSCPAVPLPQLGRETVTGTDAGWVRPNATVFGTSVPIHIQPHEVKTFKFAVGPGDKFVDIHVTEEGSSSTDLIDWKTTYGIRSCPDRTTFNTLTIRSTDCCHCADPVDMYVAVRWRGAKGTHLTIKGAVETPRHDEACLLGHFFFLYVSVGVLVGIGLFSPCAYFWITLIRYQEREKHVRASRKFWTAFDNDDGL